MQQLVRVVDLIAEMPAGDAVVAAQVDKLFDVFMADVPATTDNHGVDGDLRLELQTFHAVEYRDDVAADRQCAVVSQPHHVVLLQIGLVASGTSVVEGVP